MFNKNRSAGATLGAAFLFLSFTAVPVSLHAVGLNVHFSPSVNAVIDVWDEIAGAFQAGSQPVTAELIALNNQDGAAPSDAPVAPAEQDCQLARNSEPPNCEPGVVSEPEMIASPAPKEQSPTARASRKNRVTRSLLGGRSIELASVRVESLGELEFKPLEIAQELKSLVINREGLLRDFKRRTSEIRQAMRYARTTKDVRALVETGNSTVVVRPAVTEARPCPQKPDNAPKLRRVRTAWLALPDAENSEI